MYAYMHAGASAGLGSSRLGTASDQAARQSLTLAPPRQRHAASNQADSRPSTPSPSNSKTNDALSDTAVTASLDSLLLRAVLQVSKPTSGDASSVASSSVQTIQMPDQDETQRQRPGEEFVTAHDLAVALALVQSMPWHASWLDRRPRSSRGHSISAADTGEDANRDDYDLWNPPQYQPEALSQVDLQLPPWETALVFYHGLQPHNGRAHLETGESC